MTTHWTKDRCRSSHPSKQFCFFDLRSSSSFTDRSSRPIGQTLTNSNQTQLNFLAINKCIHIGYLFRLIVATYWLPLRKFKDCLMRTVFPNYPCIYGHIVSCTSICVQTERYICIGLTTFCIITCSFFLFTFEQLHSRLCPL